MVKYLMQISTWHMFSHLLRHQVATSQLSVTFSDVNPADIVQGHTINDLPFGNNHNGIAFCSDVPPQVLEER